MRVILVISNTNYLARPGCSTTCAGVPDDSVATVLIIPTVASICNLKGLGWVVTNDALVVTVKGIAHVACVIRVCSSI